MGEFENSEPQPETHDLLNNLDKLRILLDEAVEAENHELAKNILEQISNQARLIDERTVHENPNDD